MATYLSIESEPREETAEPRLGASKMKWGLLGVVLVACALLAVFYKQNRPKMTSTAQRQMFVRHVGPSDSESEEHPSHDEDTTLPQWGQDGSLPLTWTHANQKYLSSANDKFFAVMQADGNLVIYDSKPNDWAASEATWASGTAGHGTGPFRLFMQTDHNLVIYDSKNRATWASNTAGHCMRCGASRLVMQNDGNLVLYAGRNALWWSGVHKDATVNQPEDEESKEHPNHDEDTTLPQWGQEGSLPLTWTHAGKKYLSSSNDKFFAVMQPDGNLVIYDSKPNDWNPTEATWASGTAGHGAGPFRLFMQSDHNLVIYDSRNRATWASNTAGHCMRCGAARLVMQNDGNLVLYAGRHALWWSGVHKDATVNQPEDEESKEHPAHDEDTTLPQWGKEGSLPLTWTHAGKKYLGSSNDKFFAVMQADGNLVIYDSKPGHWVPAEATWSSGTAGHGAGPFRLFMQSDHNLVIYDSRNRATWASNTAGHCMRCGAARLVMQNDGNLVLYAGGHALWWSGVHNDARDSDGGF